MRSLALVSITDDVVGSSPQVEIVLSTAAHMRELKDSLREKDRQEIEAFGFSSSKGLWRSYKQGLRNRTAFIDGKVAAMWGVGGVYMGSVGQPWLLTSPEVYKISPLRFARLYQKEVLHMLELFPRLMNYVSADYDEAVRLLSITGFEIGPIVKFGNGLYRKFERGI